MPYSPPIHRPAFTPSREQVRKATQKDYNKNRRDTKAQAFYESKEWRSIRKWYVKRNPLCVECKAKGLATPVQIVDHIVEIKDGGDPLCVTNLQSLCIPCHNSKTAHRSAERVNAQSNSNQR